MKKIAVMAIVLSVAGGISANAEMSSKDDALFVLVGQHCFNRNFDNSFFNHMMATGESREVAEARATGGFVNQDQFCSQYRAMIDTMRGNSRK